MCHDTVNDTLCEKVMKRTIAIAMLTLVVAVAGFYVWRDFIYQPRLCHSRPGVEAALKTGDLVLSAGGRFKSDVVRWKSESDTEFSHIGIVVRRGSMPMVVHMSSDLDVIKCQTVSDFITTADSEALEFYRFVEPIDTVKLTMALDSLLAMNKLFDGDFDIKDDEKYYCTELVLKTLRDIGDTRYKQIKYDRSLYPDDIVRSGLVRSVARISD